MNTKFNFCRHFSIPTIKRSTEILQRKNKKHLNTVSVSVSGDIDALTCNPPSLLTVSYESLQTSSKIMKIRFVFNFKILHSFNVRKNLQDMY